MRGMICRIALVVAMAIAAASAQAANDIPRPLPPPKPPAIKPIEPLNPAKPKKLDTFGDKVNRCLHYGGGKGVPPGELGAYVSRCVHAQ